MIRLHLVVEGKTEERFVYQVLAPHLGSCDLSTDARCVETSRTRFQVYKGGATSYERFKRDLIRWMKEDPNSDARFSMMLDYYRLPTDFPNMQSARKKQSISERIGILEAGLMEDLQDVRFLPYLQLHEFEALIFSSPSQLAEEFIGQDKSIRKLIEIADAYDSPEEIDDDPNSHPSQRIIGMIPEYAGRKSTAGPLVVKRIGMPILKAKCPHFRQWVEKLEQLTLAP